MKRANLGRIWGGMWRLGARRHFSRGHWLALGAMLAILAVIDGGFLRAGNSAAEFLPFSVAFHFTFLVPLLAFVGGGGAWRDELKPEAADYFLNRPIPKGTYLVVRYGAHLLCAQLDFACALALLAGFASARHVPGIAAALPAMIVAQILTVAAFSAFGFFCAALTSRWVVLGIVYGSVVEAGVGHVPLAINRLAMTHQVRTLLHRVATETWSGPGAGGGSDPWPAAVFLLLFTAVWLAAAALRFSRLELAGAKPDDGG